jgi:hypothetical protein
MISPGVKDIDEGVAFAAAFLTALKRQKPTNENVDLSAPKEYLHLPASNQLHHHQNHHQNHRQTYHRHRHGMSNPPIRKHAPSSNVGVGSMDQSMHQHFLYQQQQQQQQQHDMFARDRQHDLIGSALLRAPPHHLPLHASPTKAAPILPMNTYNVFRGGAMATNIHMAPNQRVQEILASNNSSTNSNGMDGAKDPRSQHLRAHTIAGDALVAGPSDSATKASGFDVPRFVNGRELQLRDLLTQQDRNLTTRFTINIIDQLDFVYFEEGDRRSHRTHLPIGFRGIKCRYCHAPAGKSGRFFPSSLKTLSDTNKTLYTLHRHLIKCRMTPHNAKENLDILRQSHVQERKTINTHGSQRTSFRRIWGFLCPKGIGNDFNQKFTEKEEEKEQETA